VASKKIKAKTPKSLESVDLSAVVDEGLTEEDQRMNFVAGLLRLAPTMVQIKKACRERYGIGRVATENLVARTREALHADFQAARPTSKAVQVARIESILGKLLQADGPMTPRRARIILQAEESLAKLTGNFAPVEVQHSVQVRQSVAVLVSNMSDEQWETWLQQAETRSLEPGFPAQLTTGGDPSPKSGSEEPNSP
jgi:hypothetical protein